jgi:hypothetical protein
MSKPASKRYGMDWHCVEDDFGVTHWEKVQVVLLQEIRDELKKLNGVWGCYNFQRVPQDIRRIDRRLATRMLLSGEKPKRKARP